MAYGWIERMIKDEIKTRIKFARMNREVIQTSVIEEGTRKKRETIFYRNGNRYFISVDGKPVATAFTKLDCAKRAFLNGDITDSDYVSFTKGHAAAVRYDQDKNRKNRLSNTERRHLDEIIKKANLAQKLGIINGRTDLFVPGLDLLKQLRVIHCYSSILYCFVPRSGQQLSNPSFFDLASAPSREPDNSQ